MSAKKKVATKARPAAGQKKRVPLNERNRLSVFEDLCPPDHVGRLVLVGEGETRYDDSRLQDMLNAGWKFVHKSGAMSGPFAEVGDRTVNTSSSTDSRVTKRIGSGTYYYMVIDKKFYNEDQAAKAKKVDRTEEAIKAPQHKDHKSAVAAGADKYGFTDISK